MKIVFCNQLTEMLGVQTLSACLKAAGHETALVFEPNLFATGAIKEPGLIELMSNDELVIEDILSEQPDLVGFPIEINGYHWALKIAAGLRARRPEVPIIMGGIHATMCPEVVIARPEVDYVAVGEAERSLVELCDILDGRKAGDPKKIEGIWARDRDGTEHHNGTRPDHGNLDDFPFYDKSLYYEKLPGLASEYMTTISRGCPYNCSFCFYNAVHEIVGNRKVRLRSPDHVLEELKRAKAAYPQMEAVLFHDDIFPVRTSWLAEFAPRYKAEIGLPYSCITYPTLVTEQMADLLADSGCRTVIMGVQSTNEDIRRNVMERFEKNTQILAAIRRLRERGVFVTCDHILGTPGETRADQDQALLFYAEAGPNIVKPLPLTYLPKTGMTQLAIEEGIISKEDEDDAAHGYLNSLMFKGHGYDTEWRAYFLMYGLKPILSRKLFVRMVKGGRHHALAKLPSRYGLDPLIFFVPRLMNGVLFGYDMRAKYLAWRFLEMLQYSLARKSRSRRLGLKALV
ncbi:MAG: hypothetical protein CL928_02105, partial [Deltaproteobacteria bacterium]|nr:hypothetical protein [Deltaproteobacteria bacterium]